MGCTFDGVTILGYQKNSLKEAREGIPSAHMTILEKMKKNTFSNQIKSLKFAYDELSNIDINENNTHLYIEQEMDKEAIQLTYEDKKDLLQQALNKTYESEVIIKDFTEDTVSFIINDSEKSALFSIDEESSEITLSMEESTEEMALEGEAFEDNDKVEETEKVSEEMSDNTDEKTVEESDNSEEKEKVEESDNSDDVLEDNKKEETEEEKIEESCEGQKCEEQEVFEEDEKTDENPENKDDDSDEDDTEDNDKTEEEASEENKEECGKFVIDDKEYTAEEVVNKYFADMEQARENYSNLEKSYNSLKEEYGALNESFIACENKLKKFETQELVNAVKEVLNRTDFTEEEQTSFIERCENKEFNSIQEATKEIAYIAFMNKENTNQNNTVEFSAKVDFSSMKKNTVKKENVSKNCFDKLQDYVKEK